MYRLLFPMVLALAAVAGAPQEPNKSGETYVKIKSVNETTFQNLKQDSSSPVTEIEITEPNRHVRSDDFTTENQSETTTDFVDEATEIDKRVEQAVEPAEENKTRSKTPRPRFYSKLSYFQKPNYVSGPSLTNFLERSNRRKFKSRCRCERIWNCPKLQISVPRCPDEYFMCCF